MIVNAFLQNDAILQLHCFDVCFQYQLIHNHWYFTTKQGWEKSVQASEGCKHELIELFISSIVQYYLKIDRFLEWKIWGYLKYWLKPDHIPWSTMKVMMSNWMNIYEDSAIFQIISHISSLLWNKVPPELMSNIVSFKSLKVWWKNHLRQDKTNKGFSWSRTIKQLVKKMKNHQKSVFRVFGQISY